MRDTALAPHRENSVSARRKMFQSLQSFSLISHTLLVLQVVCALVIIIVFSPYGDDVL